MTRRECLDAVSQRSTALEYTNEVDRVVLCNLHFLAHTHALTTDTCAKRTQQVESFNVTNSKHLE